MIEFITGAAGSGKSTEMMRRIDAAADSGNEICIIVPEQFSYEFDKNLYKRIGAKKFNSLSSQSFTGLARELFQLYGDGKRKGEYADETARMILVYQAISAARANPCSKRIFEKKSYQSGFAEEVSDLICEMKKSGVTPQLLAEKSAFTDKKLADKAADFSLIYSEYERLMTEYGFKDNWDDIREAAALAAYHGFFEGKSVFIDEFESFTGDQIEFIKNIIASAENVCITLRTDDVNAGEFTLFETVNNTYLQISRICREMNKRVSISKCGGHYRFKNPDIAYLSEHILRTNKKNVSGSAPIPENIKIFEAKDFYSEADYVCASIRRIIFSDRTMKYRDIAVISNNIGDYSEVLQAAFGRYEIPFFLSVEKPVLHTSIMIFFSTLLSIISSREYSSEKLFRFMKCGLLKINLTDVSLIENYCYKWDIDGATWTQRFEAPDDNLEKLEKIRKSVIKPLENLRKKISGNTTAEQLCTAVYEYISVCGAEEKTAEAMGRLIDENKAHEAAELKRLWSCLTDILDSIYSTLGEQELSAAEFRRIVNSLIGRITYSLPPQTLDSVTAASAGTARLNAPRVVFVMGVNDGDFPNTISTHGIFSESDKQRLYENGIGISRRLSELIASEKLIVYKSLSAASEKIFMTYSLSDLSGQAKYPASAVGSVMDMFGDEKILLTEAQVKPDYYAVTMKAAYYRYMQDVKLNNASISSIKRILLSNSDYSRKLAAALKNGSRKNGRFHVDTAVVERLKDLSPMRISPSSFELYNKCHFSYFCQECLRLIVREKIDMDARYTGSIIHNCFYSIISSGGKNNFINLSYAELEHQISFAARKYLEENMGGEFSKSPRFELEFRKLTERLVRIFLHAQQELAASGFEPRLYEVNLRDEENGSELALPFGNGRILSFGGIIDRADVCTINDEKYVRIVDYKKGAKKIDKYTLGSGINMQMLLYLFAVTQNGGIFSGYTPAGVLYSPVSIASIQTEEMRSETENLKAVDSMLRATGLVLGRMEVLEAMEHDILGRYVPVILDKNGKINEKKSSCISGESFGKLKNYTFRKLTEMAESVCSGDADANPLVLDKNSIPCSYCPYADICGNSAASRRREKQDIDTAEAEMILENKSDKTDKSNGSKEDGGNGNTMD